MFNPFNDNPTSGAEKPKEGDLYKVIKTFGRTFELYYGYYEETDRHSKYSEPIEIYPDLFKKPIYTDEGRPIVTAMQKPCKHYEKVNDTTDRCYDCYYFLQGEELFGLCQCDNRKKKVQKRQAETNKSKKSTFI